MNLHRIEGDKITKEAGKGLQILIGSIMYTNKHW